MEQHRDGSKEPRKRGARPAGQADPLAEAVRAAPVDPRPLSSRTRRALREAREQAARGETVGNEEAKSRR